VRACAIYIFVFVVSNLGLAGDFGSPPSDLAKQPVTGSAGNCNGCVLIDNVKPICTTEEISESESSGLFRSPYVSFFLPDNWKCNRHGKSWICQKSGHHKESDAKILISAKRVGLNDSNEKYRERLSNPISMDGKNPRLISKIIYAPKKREVNCEAWIDSIHESVNVPDYYSRYLIVIKDQIAIFVVLSAPKDKFKGRVASDFFLISMNLRLSSKLGSLKDSELLDSKSDLISELWTQSQKSKW